MKGIEALERSYQKQKEIYEEARQRRIFNRQQQIIQIQEKIDNLNSLLLKLQTENQEEKEFENFDSFRQRSQKVSK